MSPQAWHSVSLADNRLLSYSLRSCSTVRTPFSCGLASLGRQFFSAHVMAYSQFILLLVFGQRGDLGGESRYYRTRFLSPSQFVRPWVLYSLLTISLQKRSRALGLVHGLPCSSFRANQSFVEYGSLARLSPRLWHSRTGSPLRLGKPLALRYYFPQGHRTIPHQGLH